MIPHDAFGSGELEIVDTSISVIIVYLLSVLAIVTIWVVDTSISVIIVYLLLVLPIVTIWAYAFGCVAVVVFKHIWNNGSVNT